MVTKQLFQAWAAALSLLLSASALADTVTLKSGEKIVGKVMSETDQEVVIEERISASITDNRTIPKSDVASVQKESADAAAYQALKNHKPGANSMPATAYDGVIKPLQAFIAQHPKSEHLSELQANLAAFEEEKKRVDEGEVKLNGAWLSKEQAEKERYQINAQMILNHMQDQQRRGDLVGALNTFDQMDQSYAGARVYPDAVELAKQLVPALKNAADRAGKAWQFQKAEREKGIELLSEPQRSETIAANEREQRAADAAVEAATRSNSKWPPLVARSESALNTIANKTTEEANRLAALEVGKMRESIKAADEARKHLAAKEPQEAEAAVSKALALWSTNEAATRLQGEVNEARNTVAATSESAETEAMPEDASADAAPASTDAAATTAGESTDEAEGTDEVVEGEKPWFRTLPGIVISILAAILILTGVNAFRKISKRANDVLE